MTKKMLINATQSDELRVAIVEASQNTYKLDDLDVERTTKTQTKASIYKGIVTRVEPSLEAAFINFGSDRHGFLPLKEVAKEYFSENVTYDHGRPNIKDILRAGQEIVVQVDKEERGTKGAALTTFISLAGCYLVLMPNNPRAGGISRRIEGEERDDLKDVLNQLPVPDGMGLIVRTAGMGRSIEELQWDLEVLLTQWSAIQNFAQSHNAPCLIYKDSDVIVRAIRDYLRPGIEEIIVDTESAYQKVHDHLSLVRPDFVPRLKLYKESAPLFSSFRIETQIESAYQREIALNNGASIVIDHTEALIAIDINSAKATEGSDIEETALQTNMAAAAEIARQLRLRDIGGLIVIDFIDMNVPRHQRMVEGKLRDEFKSDRARIQMGRISRFGLMEMSRQRLRPALGESTQITCPRCDGQGNIRSIHSVSMAIIRVIEEEVMKDKTAQVNIQVPMEVASYLLNEKRDAITKLENAYQVAILVIPNKHFDIPHYEFQRLRRDEATQLKKTPSYKQITQPQINLPVAATKSFESQPEPDAAISHLAAKAPPAPSSTSAAKSGLISRIWKAVFGAAPAATTSKDRAGRGSDDSRDDQDNRRHQRGKGNKRQGGASHGRRDQRKRHGHNRRQGGSSKRHGEQYGSQDRYEQSGDDFQSRDQAREHQAREHQPREHQPREHQPREHQPREHQPREHQAREHQAREHQAREHQPREHAPREQRSGQDRQRHGQDGQQRHQRGQGHQRRQQHDSSRQESRQNQDGAEGAKMLSNETVTHHAPQQQTERQPQAHIAAQTTVIVPTVVHAEEKPKADRNNPALNSISFAQLSDEQKQSAFVAPLDSSTRAPAQASSEQFKQVVSKRSTYDEKPHELPTIAQYSSKRAESKAPQDETREPRFEESRKEEPRKQESQQPSSFSEAEKENSESH